jgi:hypothetical protein
MSAINTLPTPAEIREAVGRLAVQRDVMSVFEPEWAEAMTEAIGLIRGLLDQAEQA